MSATPVDLATSSDDGARPDGAGVTAASGPSNRPLVPSPVAEPGGPPAGPLLASLLAIAGGLAVWGAFPGRTAWWLAPIGVSLIWLALRGQRTGRAAWYGLLAGWAMFVPLLAWSGIYVGKLPWFALATLEALYVAAMGALSPWVWRLLSRRAGGAVVAVGLTGLWVAQEAARSRTPFGGFPWGRLAFSQADGPLLSTASIGGAPLVSATVALIAALIALAVAELAAARRSRSLPRPSGRAAGWAAAAVLVGVLPLAVPRPVEADREVRVAAVQGNVPEPGLEFNAERRAVLDNHARGTRRLADRVDQGAAPRPDVVIWPENSSDIDPKRNPDAAQVIQEAVDRIGVPVIVGTLFEEPTDHISNVSIVWGPSTPAPGPAARVPAGLGSHYVKRHPAPFGEYIPYRSFFRHFSDKVDLVRRDFVAGTASPVLDAGVVRLGDVICFEVAYDDLVRDGVRQGAELIVVQTNNATFGFTDESVQQLAMSRLRAVESGRAVVHISTVGVSGLIMPDGSLVERSEHFTAEVLQASLPVRHANTLATRVGAWPELVLAVLGGLLAAAGLRRRPARDTREPA